MAHLAKTYHFFYLAHIQVSQITTTLSSIKLILLTYPDDA